MIKKDLTKQVLLLLLIIIGGSSLKAQESNKPWPRNGAKWHYCLSNFGEDVDSEIWEVIGDTTISDKNYSIISKTDSSNDKFTIITRYENDTIYRYVNDKEYIFFTFNLKEGDVFTTFRSAGFSDSWNDSAYSSQLPLKVIEKSTTNYNDKEYNRFLLHDTLFTYLYGIEQSVIYELVEPVGVINAYPFINTQEGVSDLISDFLQVEVYSYEDDENDIVLSECNPTYLDEEPVSTYFRVSPNPSDGNFYIDIDDVSFYESKMILYSMNGAKLFETSLTQNHTNVNISDFTDGLYMMVIISPSGKTELKKIIKK